MNISNDDYKLLEELCQKNNVDKHKVVKLLQTVYNYEIKERRAGIYDILKEILRDSPSNIEGKNCHEPKF